MAAARKAGPHTPHAIARAYYRYGLVLERRDLGIITGMVQRNDGTKLDKINENGTTQWFLTYKDVPVRIIMSKDFHTVITFLPLEDMLTDAQNKRRRSRPRRRKKLFKNGVAYYTESST